MPYKTYYSRSTHAQFSNLFTYYIISVYYIILTTLSTLNVFIALKMIHPELNLTPSGVYLCNRGKSDLNSYILGI